MADANADIEATVTIHAITQGDCMGERLGRDGRAQGANVRVKASFGVGGVGC